VLEIPTIIISWFNSLYSADSTPVDFSHFKHNRVWQKLLGHAVSLVSDWDERDGREAERFS